MINQEATGVFQMDGPITINGTITIDIPAGSGQVVTYNDPENISVIPVSWTLQTAVSLPSIATHSASYIFIDNTGSVVIRDDDSFGGSDTRNLILLAMILHSPTQILDILNTPQTAYSSTADFQLLLAEEGPHNLGGNQYTANGANLSLDKSGGQLLFTGISFHSDPNQPSISNTAAESPIDFPILYTASDGDLAIHLTGQTVLDPGNYDNGGTVTAVGNNNFTLQRIYLMPDNNTDIMLGQEIFSTIDDAIAIAGKELFDVPKLMDIGILIARIAIKGNATDLTNPVEAFIIPVSGGGSGGGSGGEINTASNLAGDEGLFTTKAGVDLPFKSLTAGSGISLSSDANAVTIASDPSQIDHDQLLNYVADHHVPHTSIVLTAAVGIGGGGNIASNMFFDLDFGELSIVTDFNPGEYVAIWRSGIESTIIKADFESDLVFTESQISDLSHFGGTFLNLTDVPSSYTGQALNGIRVNAGENGPGIFHPFRSRRS